MMWWHCAQLPLRLCCSDYNTLLSLFYSLGVCWFVEVVFLFLILRFFIVVALFVL